MCFRASLTILDIVSLSSRQQAEKPSRPKDAAATIAATQLSS